MIDHELPALGSNGRIVEGIVTTANDDDSINIAPMGPIVDADFHCLVLRPFNTSTTYRNLKRTGHGVFHVTDDVLVIAQASVGQPVPPPRFLAENPLVLADTCRWYTFEVDSLDDQQERTHIVARTTTRGTQREFLGYNRAQHAVIEAAILATRVHLLDAEHLGHELARLRVIVDKTGSAVEHSALRFLEEYIEGHLASTNEGGVHPR